MSNSFLIAAALFAVVTPAFAATMDDKTAVAMAMPQESIVDQSLPKPTVTALLAPVEAFYGFWNNGSPALPERAIAPDFTDHTLPPGRPQGPSGPAAAGKAFLTAVPDLKVTVVQRMVVSDRVVSHMRFTGHFTGSFAGNRVRGSRSTSSRPTSCACGTAASPTTGTWRTT